jgi:hypothetical protein
MDILRTEFNMSKYSPLVMNFYDQVNHAIFPAYSSKKKDRVFFHFLQPRKRGDFTRRPQPSIWPSSSVSVMSHHFTIACGFKRPTHHYKNKAWLICLNRGEEMDNFQEM